MQSDADLEAAAQVKADDKIEPAPAAQKRSKPDIPPELEGTRASASKRRATGPGVSAGCVQQAFSRTPITLPELST